MRLFVALAVLTALALFAPAAAADVCVGHDDQWSLVEVGPSPDGDGLLVYVPAGTSPEDGSIYAGIC
jgi:hypothetical protein